MRFRRVFALVPDCHAKRSRYAALWRRHFYEGLEAAGVEVIKPQDVNFDWARPAAIASEKLLFPDETTSARLSREVDRAINKGLDAVISYCFSHDVDLGLVERVRAAGIPWINFFCDSMYAFHTVEALARHTSLNWFVEGAAEPRYQALGVPYLCAPYAINPLALPNGSCTRPVRTLSFVGTANRLRLKKIVLFRLAGIDVHVSGWGWPEASSPAVSDAGRSRQSLLRAAKRILANWALRKRAGGYLGDEALLEYVRGSQTLLGLNEGTLGDKPAVSYLKLRDIEFPGLGCCYLAQHNSDIGRAFEIGKEVLTFRTLREARRLSLALARNPAACQRMGALARARVMADHTWRSRLPLLAESLR